MGPRGLTLDSESGTLYICDDAQSAIISANSDGSGNVTVVYDSSDGLFRPQYVIVNTAPAIPFSTEGLPSADSKSLALTTAVLVAAAGAFFGRARQRRRKA